MKKYKIYLLFVVILVPVLSFAAFDGVKGFLNEFKALINPVITLIFGLAIVYFFWGLSQFILRSGDAKTHEEGKNKMLYGVITLFVMFSIWGILGWINGVFFGVQAGDQRSGYMTSDQGGWGLPTFGGR